MKGIWKNPLVKKLLAPDQIASLQSELKQMEGMHAEAERRGLRPGRTLDERRSFSLQMRDFFGYVLSFGAAEQFEAFLGIVPELTDN
jgi:hypothetical protein